MRTTCKWNHGATGLESIRDVVQMILKRVRLTSTKRDQSAARGTVSSSVGLRLCDRLRIAAKTAMNIPCAKILRARSVSLQNIRHFFYCWPTAMKSKQIFAPLKRAASNKIYMHLKVAWRTYHSSRCTNRCYSLEISTWLGVTVEFTATCVGNMHYWRHPGPQWDNRETM